MKFKRITQVPILYTNLKVPQKNNRTKVMNIYRNIIPLSIAGKSQSCSVILLHRMWGVFCQYTLAIMNADFKYLVINSLFSV